MTWTLRSRVPSPKSSSGAVKENTPKHARLTPQLLPQTMLTVRTRRSHG